MISNNLFGGNLVSMVFSYFLHPTTGHGFKAVVSGIPSGDWFHLVVIYNNHGNSLTVYYNGEKVGSDLSKNLNPDVNRSSSSGSMVLGRLLTQVDGKYASVMADEVTLWNN